MLNGAVHPSRESHSSSEDTTWFPSSHFSVRYWVLPTTKLQRSPVLLDSLTWSRSWQSCLGLMVRFELGVQLWPQLHSSFRSAKKLLTWVINALGEVELVCALLNLVLNKRASAVRRRAARARVCHLGSVLKLGQCLGRVRLAFVILNVNGYVVFHLPVGSVLCSVDHGALLDVIRVKLQVQRNARAHERAGQHVPRLIFENGRREGAVHVLFRAGGVDVHEGRVPVVLVRDLEERAPRCGDGAGRHSGSPQCRREEHGKHVGERC